MDSRARRPALALGLTGSIGMGKSTVAAMLRELSIAVLDADEVVRGLYASGAAGATAVRELFGSSVVDATTGDVDRAALAKIVLTNDKNMEALERAIHPLVELARENFRREREDVGDDVVAYDVPLLFEKGYESSFDAIAVVSAKSDEIQRMRVLMRPGMTEEKFEAIKARQMPDEEKRRRATYVLHTGTSMEETRAAVRAMVDDLRRTHART